MSATANGSSGVSRGRLEHILRAQQEALEAIARRLDRLEDLILSRAGEQIALKRDLREAAAERELAAATRESTAAAVEAERYGGGASI